MRLCILICLASLCGLAISCNPEWFSYNQKCYRAIKFPYDVRLARRYCQIFRGDLATISDNATLQSFYNNLINVTNELYWVNENSTIGENSTASACNYIYYDKKMVLDLQGECGEGKFFICEVTEEDKSFSCPKSWSLYGETCYKTFTTKAVFADAVSFCSLQRAQLAILDNIAKEHNAAAVIIGQKEPFLVGVLEDTMPTGSAEVIAHWSNGNIFQPSCAECRNHTRVLGRCIGFSSDPQHPTMFTWVNLNCNNTNSFLCEMPTLVSSQTTTQSSRAPTTTMAPLRCPVGYNWKVHEDSGYCFWETTYETERLNWYQARQFCQLYGGDLATYDSREQEEHGLGGAKGHYRGLWFGLKREDNDVIKRVDGEELSYTNWNQNEPNLKSRSKFCVMHGSYFSEWALDYCGVRRWFICKAPKMREPKLPDLDFFKKTQCNFTGSSIYRTQWYLYDNHCYLVKDSAKYSWDTAKYFCEDNGGHLASIHSFEETNFILQVIPSSTSTDYWIGLSARGLDSPYTWSDGSSTDFFYWADDYNETAKIDKCFNINKERGFWNAEHCNRFFGVICKRGVNASYDFTTPEPTALMPGNCEKGWYRFGNKCLKTFGEKWSQRKSWLSALANCKEQDANLLSIHSSEEQDFVMDLLLDLKTSSWIGLQSSDRGLIFKWSDDSALDYTNWNAGQPAGGINYDGMSLTNLCLELDYDSHELGKWNDVDCVRERGYICQKSINHTLTEPSEDPFKCSNLTDWHRLGSSCYGIFNEVEDHLPWIAAQAKCRTFNSNLVTFRSFAVPIYLEKRIKKKDEFFWIGTRETKPNKYDSIGSGPFLTNWLAGQPQRTSQMDNCVSIDSSGKWVVKNCKEKHPFICELRPKEEETTDIIEDNKSCPTAAEWVDLGGDQCYYFGHRRVNWNTALYECYKNGGRLASFHSLDEMLLVKNYLALSSEESSYHIGLGKKSDSSYGWVDFSPVDFTYWENPPSATTSMKCVQLHPKSALWRPVDCEDMFRNYICSHPKRISRKEDSYNSTSIETSKIIQDEVYQSGLGAGGITGIVISVFIIAFVIGGLIYHFYPSSTIKPSFLDSESL